MTAIVNLVSGLAWPFVVALGVWYFGATSIREPIAGIQDTARVPYLRRSIALLLEMNVLRSVLVA